MSEPTIIISGAGVAGLLLALALKKIGMSVSVYEQSPQLSDGVGGAIGLYPNGLKIIRDLNKELFDEIRSKGRPYVLRKWYRHDGTLIATGKESYLLLAAARKGVVENELSSMGIRRYRLQNALRDACVRESIPIVMGVRINSTAIQNVGGPVKCVLSNGQEITADLLFGCDGVKSSIRTSLFGSEIDPKYTGITCLMGSAPIAQTSAINGICFPSSSTTNCHACFYPCNDKEIIFQLFFPTEEKPETWKALTKEEAEKECLDLQKTLIKDGWASMFTDPLSKADSVLRVGLRARNPIPVWHSSSPTDNIPRIFLLGDAAHPPVPYIGQGAMMAIEDVGILSLLLQKLCKPSQTTPFNYTNLGKVAHLYEQLRIPRTTAMLAASQSLGDMQLARGNASSWFEGWRKEISIWFNVQRYGTLPVMFQGSGYDYVEAVEGVLNLAKL